MEPAYSLLWWNDGYRWFPFSRLLILINLPKTCDIGQITQIEYSFLSPDIDRSIRSKLRSQIISKRANPQNLLRVHVWCLIVSFLRTIQRICYDIRIITIKTILWIIRLCSFALLLIRFRISLPLGFNQMRYILIVGNKLGVDNKIAAIPIAITSNGPLGHGSG